MLNLAGAVAVAWGCRSAAGLWRRINTAGCGWCRSRSRSGVARRLMLAVAAEFQRLPLHINSCHINSCRQSLYRSLFASEYPDLPIVMPQINGTLRACTAGQLVCYFSISRRACHGEICGLSLSLLCLISEA